MMINQTTEKSLLNDGGLDVLKGTGVAVLSAYLPLAFSFAGCHALGLNGTEYPEVSRVAAIVGVVLVFLSLPVAYELRNRSVLQIAGSSVVIFSVLGALASFTM